jgi:hypothetical protein
VGDLLLEQGVITQEQLSEALRHKARVGGRLGTNLVELGFIDERTLANFLAQQLNIPSVGPSQLERIAADVLHRVPAPVAERLRAVPLREDAGKLWVAMADPTDKEALDELAHVAKLPVRPMVVPELLLQYALERHYHVARRPRIVEVRTAGSELFQIEDGTRSAPRDPPQVADAPVYSPMGEMPQTLDAVTGFLDEAGERASARPNAPPAPLSLDEVSHRLAEADSDEAVFEVALQFLQPEVPRLCVLLLRDGQLTGWRGRGVDATEVASIKVAIADAPIVASAFASGQVFVGRLTAASLNRVARPLGLVNEALGIVLPISIGKHAIGCILGLDPSLQLIRRTVELGKLMRKVDQALHIGYLRRQLLAP